MSKRIISIILTVLLVASISSLSAFSAAADTLSDDEVIAVDLKADLDLASVGDDDTQPDSQQVEDDLLAQADQLPGSIDLRDYNGMNYVTPVKFQNPFGTCWAFGIAAASEISFLHDNDLGVPAGEVNNTVDFSEKYITWYLYHAITEDDVMTGAVRASQVGEGHSLPELESKNPNAVFELGGFVSYASNFFASGMGPALEDTEVNGEYPYYYAGKNRWRQNDRDLTDELAAIRQSYFKAYYKSAAADLVKHGYIENVDEYDEWFDENWGEGFLLYTKSFQRSNYAGYDDWSLPLNAEYRFPAIASYFKNSYVLPEISGKNGDGDYEFRPLGLAAIKLELAKGHGVSIGFKADQSKPNQDVGDAGYLNTTNWAQYYNGAKQSDHAVAIVGYDDNYPKENFTRTANGETVEGSTPPADGAFIVKNSWGALTEEDKATVTYDIDGNPVYQSPDANSWGYEDSGYFYLSYYDHSISAPESFDFYTKDEIKYNETNYDQYDLLQGGQYNAFSFQTETKMANIFDAEEDEYLYQISYMTQSPMTTVHYAVYKDVEDNDPTSGVLLEEGEKTVTFGGYQRFDLKREYHLKQGQKYSVVITQSHKTDDADVYDMLFSYGMNEGENVTVTGVVNPGESFLYNSGEWVDLGAEDTKANCIDLLYNELLAGMGEEQVSEMLPNGKADLVIDNFPIKAFLVPDEIRGLDNLLGDADCDNLVSIMDVTAIQRDLAKLGELTETGLLLADVDQENGLSIIDATWIQRYLASLSCPEGIGKPVSTTPTPEPDVEPDTQPDTQPETQPETEPQGAPLVDDPTDPQIIP